jgi:hypothetical protein
MTPFGKVSRLRCAKTCPSTDGIKALAINCTFQYARQSLTSNLTLSGDYAKHYTLHSTGGKKFVL